ncbi:hypothetical protein niasHS_017420 [Heterodera schachtii]|uniref:FLYWCH-type domain-containing protein n=1 Tax=Heterodera schachtii TaxID=97005 RepID=A0ABD2I4T1_HETSC
MSRREQLERNLNVKKPRIALTDDSIAADEIADAREAEMRAAATADSDASAFSDEENTEPVKFERGTTQKGALCLWHRGYKFVKRRCTWFSCCQKTCQATVRLDDEQHLTGRLGSKEHNHCAVFAQQSADAGRAQIKRAIEVDPQLRPSQMRAQVRAGTADETFDQLGTNDALDRMVQRVKNKLVGNVNRANPLEIRFAPELLNKDGESVLIYDSRTQRVNEADVVMVFSHSKLLDVLRRNRRWSLDGTFRSAPTQWTQAFIVGAYVDKRMVVCAQALLPGKNSRFYREALSAIGNAVASAPARNFEKSMMRAAREVFPEALQSGCNFHWAQCLFRKAKSLGIFNLFNGNDEEAEEERKNVHRTFRKVLTLALLPPMHVRRAFALTTERAPLGMQTWLSYVAKTFIGLTQAEQRLGIVAFEPQHISFLSRSSNTMRSHLRTLSMESTDFSTLSGDHSYVVQFGRPSPAPSTPTMSSINDGMGRGHRWNLPITRPPKYNVDFWNVYDRAQAALERTNNAMESAHGQFARDLNHHPSLGAFLAAFVKDIDKQRDIAQAIRLGKIRNRRPKYVIKEQRVVEILETARFGTNKELMEVCNLLGLVMQGFVGGLHVRNNESDVDSEDD